MTLPFSRQRLADGVERFGDGGVDEAAGVDDDQVGAVIGRRDRVALGAQLRQDLLGIDQRLRAAERDEAYARRCNRRVTWFAHGDGNDLKIGINGPN